VDPSLQRERNKGIEREQKMFLGSFFIVIRMLYRTGIKERKKLRRREEAVNHKSLLTSRADKELNTLPFGSYGTLLE
jgi:hypothetical protein